MTEPAPASDKGKKEKPAKKASFMGWLLVCAPIMLLLGFFYPPLFMIVTLMSPGWFALLSDGGEDRALGVCVCSGTLGGVMFYLADQLLSPPAIENALLSLQQPSTWLFPLAGAAIGAGMFYLIPVMVIESVYARNVAHKKSLEDAQKKLIEEWGEGVKG